MMPILAGILNQQGEGSGWSYYRTVTIDNTGGDAHTDWAVSISLTSGNFDFANADADGIDLQFRATDGETVLPYWREAYDDVAETATLWVKVPSVPADDTVDVRLYYGNSSAIDASDVESVFLFGEDFRTPEAATNMLNGSLADGVTALLTSTELYDVLAIHGGTGWREVQVMEQSNIVWTGTEYVFLVTGLDASDDSDVGLYYASDIAGTWTEYGEVLPLTEDPYIAVTTTGDLYTDGSGWAYVFFERKTAGTPLSQNDVGVARTKNFRTDWEVWDGSAWTTTVANHAAVLVRTPGEWDQTRTASPCVVHDGTQFVCIYEGTDGGSNRTGVARSTDGITWTKEATNPILALEVVDDVVLVDGVWWMTGHGGTGDQYRFKSVTDGPGAWSSTSFAVAGALPYERGGNSVNLAFGFDGSESWATFQDGLGVSGIQLFRWVGGDKWAPACTGPSDSIRTESINNPSGLTGSSLKLQVAATTGSYAVGLVSATDVGTNANFAVRCSHKQTAGASDDQYSNVVAVGSGNPMHDASTGYSFIDNGYLFSILNPDEFAPVIREYSTSFRTPNISATNNMTTAEAQVYAIHECSYLSTGALDYRYNGASRASGSDTDRLSGNKRVLLSQGNQSGRLGGSSEYEWFVVRPYDGLDPSSSVGSETAA